MLKEIFKYLRFGQCVYWNIYDCLSDAEKEFKIHDYFSDDKENQRGFQEYERKKDLYFKVRESFIPIFISSLSLDEIKILEIGGGYNSVYDYVEDSTNQKINVTVLEKKKVVDTIYELISEKRKSFITLQVNTYPFIVPQKLNNIDEIIIKFKMYDYNLIYKSKRKPGKHNLLLKDEYFHRDLIFKQSKL
ncbi:MAG: hypothetical protein QGF80_03840 [Pelagibacteraceae bacterium]|jgi:hypothetical protein|nr:hypothetical protein [Candidatus Pelagibacter sp.]MDP6680849.1 hypothetical protein [Pelagibacteraceae bacterium]|tara:strand:+ start:246 stop:815 length:570 start_codon:yes stop_codon:yes gene_type:complete